MNFLHLIDREETVSGLALTDSSVRLAYFKKAKKNEEILAFAEASLAPGTIASGAVANPRALSMALSKLLSETDGDVSFCVVSLPPDRIYSKVLSFPQGLPPDRLDDAVRLSLGFQLPFPAEKVNVGYERLPSAEVTEVFLAACPKEVIDGYQAVLKSVGIRTVAAESHTMSIARALKSHEGQILVPLPAATSVTFALLDAGYVRFSRTVPLSSVPTPEMISEEMRKVHDFCATEWNASVLDKSLEELAAESLQSTAQKSAGPEWLPSLGALSRGRLPREEDTMVSLLPIGTRQAYAYQKAMAFSSFLQNAIIGIAIFFVIAYIAAFFIMLSIKQRFTEELASISLSPAGAQVIEQEKKALEFNALLSTGGALVRESPHWSDFIARAKGAVGDGISISNMTLSSPTDPIHMSGIARSRAQLNAFKKELEGLPEITEVTLPLTNLELRADIPFSVTFKLKDAATVLPQ